MKKKLTSLSILLLLSVPAINGQTCVGTNDRVFVGVYALSRLSKEMDHGNTSPYKVANENLRDKLKSFGLNAVILQQRKIGNANKYFVQLTMRKSTKFDQMEISKEDFDKLLSLADKLHE